jgi:hypothetical protein
MVDVLLRSPQSLREELSKNLFAYTDHEPAEESVFLYFDLAPSVAVQERVAEVRASIMGVLDPGSDVRFTDASEQHCTAFTEMRRTPLGGLQGYVNQTALKYAHAISAEPPFLLWVGGPVMLCGGIVLECTVASATISKLRNVGRENQFPIPEGASRSIYDLLHSTIAYIADATAGDLQRVRNEFDAWPEENCLIPVFIRELRITGTRNKRLSGTPSLLPLRGEYFGNYQTGEAVSVLKLILRESAEWQVDGALSRRVFETAVQALQFYKDTNIVRLAKQLLTMSLPYACGSHSL